MDKEGELRGMVIEQGELTREVKNVEYITKKDLIDCSTPDEFCFFTMFAWNVKQYEK